MLFLACLLLLNTITNLKYIKTKKNRMQWSYLLHIGY